MQFSKSNTPKSGGHTGEFDGLGIREKVGVSEARALKSNGVNKLLFWYFVPAAGN